MLLRQVKAASEFHKSKRRRLGLHIYCKTCCAAASASRAKTKQPVTQPTVDAKARMSALEAYMRCGNKALLGVNLYCIPAGQRCWHSNVQSCEKKGAGGSSFTLRGKLIGCSIGMCFLAQHPESPAQECSRCKQTKPASAYFRDKWRATGLCSYCKACSAASVACKHEAAASEEPTVSSKVRLTRRRERLSGQSRRSHGPVISLMLFTAPAKSDGQSTSDSSC